MYYVNITKTLLGVKIVYFQDLAQDIGFRKNKFKIIM